jgi:hypothetical protein
MLWPHAPRQFALDCLSRVALVGTMIELADISRADHSGRS